MAMIEQVEMAAQHTHLVSDIRVLMEKYRAIFDWNVPDIDQPRADKLILDTMRKAIDGIEQELPETVPLAQAVA
jgi:hypothetical protein